MQESDADQSINVQDGKCPTCGTDFKPKLDISIPGLSRLFNASYGKITKILWLFIMVICVITCICLTVYQLQVYFKYPVTSKTFIKRIQQVQFPAFSVCTFYDPRFDNRYTKLLRKEVIRKCHQYGVQNCENNFAKITLKDLDISLQQIWDQCHFNSVEIFIHSVRNDSNSTETSRRHSALGSCTLIKHTGKLTYLSALLQLDVTLKSKDVSDIIFIPHGIPEFKTSDYELFKHEMEYIQVGVETQLRIQEEMFSLQNVSERKCYDFIVERQRIEQEALELIRNQGACRLPFLPGCFPECQTYTDVATSLQKVVTALTEMLSDASWSDRFACEYKIYAISLDYVVPLEERDKEENLNVTKLIIKFADDTSMHISEHFSYTFPELVGDLFAYWGFFLCLSAPVFVEIIEFLSLKIFSWIKLIIERKEQK